MKDGISHPEMVASREDFVAFVERLRADLVLHPDEWENPTLAGFLEALSAYAQNVPGYTRNTKSSIDPEQPSWQLFALILAGARVYE